MKNLFFLLMFSSLLTISAQQEKVKSLVELRYQALNNSETKSNNTDFGLPINKQTEILNQASSIQYQAAEGRKNPGLAIIYSMLLPGMGELYAGSYESGKYYTIADGLLWGVFAGFNIYGNWKEDNYKAFAQSNAGVNIQGKESEFFANVSSYLSVDDYNTEKELNRDFEQVYNTTEYYWKWASNEQRREYRELWSSSEQAYNNVRFAVGALILNRLISAINAVRLVAAHNRNLSTQTSWNVSFGVDNNPTLPSSLKINFVKSF